MKKIIICACIILMAALFSPAMAQDGPVEGRDRQGDRIDRRLDRQGDRRDDHRLDSGKDHWRGKRSTNFVNPRGYRGNHAFRGYHYRHRGSMYSRYKGRHNRHMFTRFNNRHYRYKKSW